MSVAANVGVSDTSSLVGSFNGEEVIGMSVYASDFLVGGGESCLATRRLLRAGGEFGIVCCGSSCADGLGNTMVSSSLPMIVGESSLVRASSFRQLRKML